MSFTTHLSGNNPSIPDAGKSFTNTIAEAARSNNLESALWKSWRELFEHAGSTPHSSQSTIIELVQAIHKNEDPKKENGELYQIWNEDFHWEKLPLFGAQAREEWDVVPDTKSPSKTQAAWINKNAFLAHLTTLSSPKDALDFALYGIWTIRAALEEIDLSSSLPSPTDSKAAAVWFIYASETLKKRSREGQEFEGRMGCEGNAIEERGWRGFNSERWELWAGRMKEVMEKVEGEDVEVRELVGRAVEAMNVK